MQDGLPRLESCVETPLAIILAKQSLRTILLHTSCECLVCGGAGQRAEAGGVRGGVQPGPGQPLQAGPGQGWLQRACSSWH